MTPKEARDYARKLAITCPNCGSPSVLRFHNPCGLTDESVTSLSKAIAMRTVFLQAIEEAEERFVSNMATDDRELYKTLRDKYTN